MCGSIFSGLFGGDDTPTVTQVKSEPAVTAVSDVSKDVGRGGSGEAKRKAKTAYGFNNGVSTPLGSADKLGKTGGQ